MSIRPEVRYDLVVRQNEGESSQLLQVQDLAAGEYEDSPLPSWKYYPEVSEVL